MTDDGQRQLCYKAPACLEVQDVFYRLLVSRDRYILGKFVKKPHNPVTERESNAPAIHKGETIYVKFY
jgi:hypothetical protein